MKKYLKDGREITVEHETTSGLLVVRPLLYCEDGECSCYYENIIVISAKEVLDMPPVQSYHTEIASLKKEIFEQKSRRRKLTNELMDLVKELRLVKNELNNDDMVIARAIKKVGSFISNPSLLTDYFTDKIAFVVTYNQYCASIHSFDNIYKSTLDLRLESGSNRAAVLLVKINDSYWQGTPFASKEEALEFFKEKLEDLFNNDRGEYAMREAKKHEITLDNKYIKQYNKHKEQEREKKKKDLKRKIDELG